MFCRRCGASVKQEDRFCPQCGEVVNAPNLQEKSAFPPSGTSVSGDKLFEENSGFTPAQAGATSVAAQQAKKPARKNKRKAVIAIICVAALVISSLGLGFFFFKKDNKKTIDYLADKDYISIEDTISDIPITDEESALSVIEKAKRLLPIGNAHKQLKLNCVKKSGKCSYYSFNQYCRNIRVWGRSIVVGCDEDGNNTGLTSNAASDAVADDQKDYPDSGKVCDAVNQASAQAEQESEESLEKQAQTILENLKEALKTDSLSIVPNGEAFVYFVNEAQELELAYRWYVGTEQTIYEVLISARSGKILQMEACLDTAAQSAFAAAQSNSSAEETDSDNALTDKDYHINIFDLKGFAASDKEEQTDFTKFGFETSSSENNKSAATALQQFSAFSEYFHDLGDDGFDYVHVALNDKYQDGQNVRGGSIVIDGESRAIILLGENIGVEQTDILGHGYVHCVTDKLVGFKNTSENEMPKAIEIAISDLFAVLLEQEYCQWDEPDWKVGEERNLKDPQSNGFPVTPEDKNAADQDYAHGYSTVISHAAYLMWNGIDGDEQMKLDSETLAQLWYNALQWMHANASFSQCASAVQMAANVMANNDQLTAKQLECVKTAFERANIIPAAKSSIEVLQPAFTLNVLSSNENEHVTYAYTLTRLPNIFTKEGNKDSDVEKVDEGISKEGNKAFSLEPGYYLLTLTDKAEKGEASTYSIKIQVSDTDDQAKDSLSLKTDFYDVTADESDRKEPENEMEKTAFGNVVSDGESIYYWKYNANSFTDDSVVADGFYYHTETENELIRRTANGEESVILKGNGAGEIGLTNDRLYYSDIDSQYSNNYRDMPQIIRSCKKDGSDDREIMTGCLKGVVEGGKYVIVDIGDNESGGKLISYNTENEEQTVLCEHNYETCFLATSEKWVLCVLPQEDTDNIADKVYTVFKISASADDKVELNTNAGRDLESIQSVLEYSPRALGVLAFENIYVKDETFYYLFKHIDGTAHVTESLKAYKIDLNSDEVQEIEVDLNYGEGNQKDPMEIHEKEYADFIMRKTTCIQSGEFPGYSKELFASEGENDFAQVYYCENIGDKQYIFITVGKFGGNQGWRTLYQFNSCALFEKDLKSNETTLLYSAER